MAPRLRGYIVSVPDAECAVAVVAKYADKAKVMANKSDLLQDAEYIELRCHLAKTEDGVECNVDGLKEGVVEDVIEAMRRGFFVYCLYADCPACGAKCVTVHIENGIFSCDSCQESV